MSAKRTFYIMLAVLVLLGAGIIGAAYGTQVVLKGESEKLVSLKARVGALDQQQQSLKQAKKDITTYTDLYKISKVVVPENKNQAQAVRQIVKLADDNNIVLDSINFPTSTLGTTTNTSAKVAPADSTGGTSAATGSASLSQLIPVPKIPGVYDLQLTVASSARQLATYTELISFLSALEHNRQTALVSSINIQPDSQNHKLFSFNLILDIYIKP